MKTETISQSTLADFLLGITHAEPVSFSALVIPKFRKTGNPFSEIFKFSTVNAFTGADYENSVNRQLAREGKDQLEFHAKERSWGNRISPALVENHGKLYLVAQIQRTGHPVYLARKDGGKLAIVAKAAIASFLAPITHAENQGTEKEILYRNYGLASIIAMNAKGHRFRIR